MSKLGKSTVFLLFLSVCFVRRVHCSTAKKCFGMMLGTERMVPTLRQSRVFVEGGPAAGGLVTAGRQVASSFGAVLQAVVFALSMRQPANFRARAPSTLLDLTCRSADALTSLVVLAMAARRGCRNTFSVRHLLCMLLLVGWVGSTDSSRIKARKRELYIAGLFPFTGARATVGRGVKPAVDLALRHVNSDRTILPNYELKISFNDTKCDMAVATKAFFDLTYDNATTEAIVFGDACYSVTGPMAEISYEWGMFQLSYGDTDPLLSDRDKYPNFFRTVPCDSDYNPARLALLRHFNWSSVGTLFQDASQGGSARYGYAHNRFDSLMEKHRINISKAESFADDPSTAIQNLKDHDVRIIVGNFDESMARKVFCSARQKEMYGPRHQWIILGDYSSDWWKVPDSRVSCTPEMLNDTLDGYLATAILPLSTDEELTEWGKTPGEYKRLYDAERGQDYSVYHGYAYDGIWVIAHALHRLLGEDTGREQGNMPGSLEGFLRGARVGKALNDTNIRGVTGRVQFNNGDRVGVTNILQMQAGKLVKVAEYSAFTEQLDFSKGEAILWRGGRVPRDRTIQYEEMRHVSTPVYLTLVALSSFGVIMACCFLGLNIRFRRHRFIKMSSPNMNNIIIVGCILCYLSIVLLGTDGSIASTSPAVFRYWCRARAWVLALGFTLAFGAMFGKTWRVHAIFTNIKLNKKVIKDYKLMLLVLVLVLLDVAILITWQVLDPFEKAEKKLSPEVYTDYEVIPKLEYCSSHHMEIWLGSIYAYKGLLLAFGCFLAWETRHVSIPALNDSKYIGLSVYNVVIMCTCGAAVTFIIRDQPTHSFVIIAVFIIFATTATLCLVFVPKIIQLRRDPKGEEKRIRATLRKPSPSYSLENDRFQQQVKLTTEENRRLRGFLEQKAKELEHVLEQLGEEGCAQDGHIRSASALHKKILELRTSDVSPSKISRTSSHSDVDLTSTASDISDMTSSLLMADSPPGSRQLKSRILNSRMYVEAIEMAEMRRKSSSTIPPPAEEEVEEEEDPFGGVYLGPSEPPPPKRQPPSLTKNSTTDQHHQVATTPTHVYDGGGRSRRDFQVYDELNQERTHHISVPSFIGLSSKTTAPPVRHARFNRRQSAPLTIWPISENGEGDDGHLSRLDKPQEVTTSTRAREASLRAGDGRELGCADSRSSMGVEKHLGEVGGTAQAPVSSCVKAAASDDFKEGEGTLAAHTGENADVAGAGHADGGDSVEFFTPDARESVGSSTGSDIAELSLANLFSENVGESENAAGPDLVEISADVPAHASVESRPEQLREEIMFSGTGETAGRGSSQGEDSGVDSVAACSILGPGRRVEAVEDSATGGRAFETQPERDAAGTAEPTAHDADAVPYVREAGVGSVSVVSGVSASDASASEFSQSSDAPVVANLHEEENQQHVTFDDAVENTVQTPLSDRSAVTETHFCAGDYWKLGSGHALAESSTADSRHAKLISCQHPQDSPSLSPTPDDSPQDFPTDIPPPVFCCPEEEQSHHEASRSQQVLCCHVTSRTEDQHGCHRHAFNPDAVFHEHRTLLSSHVTFSKTAHLPRQAATSETPAHPRHLRAAQGLPDHAEPGQLTPPARCEDAARGTGHAGLGFSVQVYPEQKTQGHADVKAECKGLDCSADARTGEATELMARDGTRSTIEDEEEEFWASVAMMQPSPNKRVTFKCDVIEHL